MELEVRVTHQLVSACRLAPRKMGGKGRRHLHILSCWLWIFWAYFVLRGIGFWGVLWSYFFKKILNLQISYFLATKVAPKKTTCPSQDAGSLVNTQDYMDHMFASWWFQTFYFHPFLGKISNLTNIFQMGWNHQPVVVVSETLKLNLHLPLGIIGGG